METLRDILGIFTLQLLVCSSPIVFDICPAERFHSKLDLWSHLRSFLFLCIIALDWQIVRHQWVSVMSQADYGLRSQEWLQQGCPRWSTWPYAAAIFRQHLFIGSGLRSWCWQDFWRGLRWWVQRSQVRQNSAVCHARLRSSLEHLLKWQSTFQTTL